MAGLDLQYSKVKFSEKAAATRCPIIFFVKLICFLKFTLFCTIFSCLC